MHVVVIGGGAAGFFAAISARLHHPAARVTLLEKSDKPLAKVRISGGGRCNVTHACFDDRKLAKHYPRGGAFLRKAFAQWSVKDTVAWFATQGVRLKTEADGRMFPVTDDSGTVMDALMHAAHASGVELKLRCPVMALERTAMGWKVHLRDGTLQADHVIVCSGGSPSRQGLQWLADLGHTIVDPVPSLFTFNLPDDPIRTLMGVSVDPARVWLPGTDLEAEGPLLITHWGLSGPAVLRLSAWGARWLNGRQYAFTVRVDWLRPLEAKEARARIAEEASAHPKRQCGNLEALPLPQRLWTFLLHKADLAPDKPLGEVGPRQMDRLLDVLTNDRYEARGKTTFKEEFVTAGGVDLAQVDPHSMRSLRLPNLSFAGEVLDIDGITGGFNFQAAWTTGWIAGTHIFDA
ncbi:MAG: NAD(P)/FAD-dependent oxidoreductase [Flavobacteriales bacterium]|nr:NAD(P)/FAD-dependent oxidoreductase [Flavobacteriales bacterium]